MKQFDMELLAPDVFEVTLPSSGKIIKMRPFVVKEYKALMLAKEGGDPNLAVEQALKNCIVEGDVNFMELPVYDAEYLFLQLYMSSTGLNVIPVKYKCAKENEDGTKCNNIIDANISIESAWVPKVDSNPIFRINKQVAVEMRYPTLRESTENNMNTTEGVLKTIISCIKRVYTDEQSWTVEDLGDKIEEVLDMMPGTILGDLGAYMKEMPRVTSIVDVKCDKCGHEEKITLQGLDDFFV